MMNGVLERSKQGGSLPGLLGAIRRDPDVEGLARLDGRIEGSHGLFERSRGVEAVRVEDVDIVEAQAAQALIEAGEQVFAGSPFSVGAIPHRHIPPWSR